MASGRLLCILQNVLILFFALWLCAVHPRLRAAHGLPGDATHLALCVAAAHGAHLAARGGERGLVQERTWIPSHQFL